MAPHLPLPCSSSQRQLAVRLPACHQMIGHPPAEVRAAALKAMDVLDPFDADTTAQEISAARALASEAEDQFIMLSDVHLDNPVVCDGSGS